MSEEDWKCIAETILYNQHAILTYIKKHSDDMDDEYKKLIEGYLNRTAADIMFRL